MVSGAIRPLYGSLGVKGLISYIGVPSSGPHPCAATCPRSIFVRNYILLSGFFGVTLNRLPKFKFIFAGKVFQDLVAVMTVIKWEMNTEDYFEKTGKFIVRRTLLW